MQSIMVDSMEEFIDVLCEKGFVDFRSSIVEIPMEVQGKEIVLNHVISNMSQLNLGHLKQTLYRLLHFTPDNQIPPKDLPDQMLKTLEIPDDALIILSSARYAESQVPILFFFNYITTSKEMKDGEKLLSRHATDCQYLIGTQELQTTPEVVFEIQEEAAFSVAKIISCYRYDVLDITRLFNFKREEWENDSPVLEQYQDFNMVFKKYFDTVCANVASDGIARHIFLMINSDVPKAKKEKMESDKTLISAYWLSAGRMDMDRKTFVMEDDSVYDGMDVASVMDRNVNTFKETGKVEELPVTFVTMELPCHDEFLNTLARNFCIYVKK